MLAFILLLFIAFEAEGTLQAWHRKDCPLVIDLSPHLSNLVAQHCNLSEHYYGNPPPNYRAPHLRIILRKLAFRKTSNKQAIAVLKFLNRGGHRQYFFALLENCVEEDKKEEKKLLYFELNTQYLSLEKIYPSLGEAINAAALFESSGKWAEQNSGRAVVNPKTNTQKRLIQGIGWTLFAAASPVTVPVAAVGCLLWIGNGCPRKTTDYHELKPHWEMSAAAPWKKGTYGTLEMEVHEGKTCRIGVKVYDEVGMTARVAINKELEV